MYTLILTAFFLTSGCATDNDVVRKDEFQSIKSNVSEELYKTRSVTDEVKWKVAEANKKTEDLEKELAELKSSIIQNNTVIEQKLKKLHNAVVSADTKRVESSKIFNNRLNAVLDEVTRENERIMAQISKISSHKRTSSKRSSVLTSKDGIHVIQSGETLSEIASAYNTTIDELMDANDIDDPNKVRVGQELIVPE